MCTDEISNITTSVIVHHGGRLKQHIVPCARIDASLSHATIYDDDDCRRYVLFYIVATYIGWTALLMLDDLADRAVVSAGAPHQNYNN
eukprot:scaffold197419_cov22-Prasinocladus_malaysianus.AAC.1